jgi:hypothetical protein
MWQTYIEAGTAAAALPPLAMSLTIVTSFPDIAIPPVLLTVPTTEREVLTAARALERFIIANRAQEGLEEALGKVLVSKGFHVRAQVSHPPLLAAV